MKAIRDPYTLLGWAAMLSVPLAPAFFFGFSFATDVYTLLVGWIGIAWVAVVVAVVVGIVSAAGLELVGILSGHNAVRFWEAGNRVSAAACTVILICYVLLGIAGLESWLAMGTVMFLVAPLTYLLVGMQGQLNKREVRQATQERQSIAIELRREEAAAQRQHALDMERLRLDAGVRTERIKAKAELAHSKPEPAPIALVPAQSQHECGKCGRPFGSVQGKNAHQRFCTGHSVKAINGLASRPQLFEQG